MDLNEHMRLSNFLWRQKVKKRGKSLVLNASFNNISVVSRWSVLVVVENGVPGENYRPVVSHWYTFFTYCGIEYTSPWTGFELTTLVSIDTDCTGSCKCNYHIYDHDYDDQLMYKNIAFIAALQFSHSRMTSTMSITETIHLSVKQSLVYS